MRGLTLVVAILLGSEAPFAHASNNGFLLGDAFFPTVVTGEDLSVLERPAKEPREFRHDWLGGHQFTFCGYAGFYKARIPEMDDTFAENLAKVYRELREHQPRELREQRRDGKVTFVETNPMRVMFYPEAFDIGEHSLALTFNEGYKAEILKFGHSKDFPGRIGCLVNSRDAVEDCWANAENVPGLKAEYGRFEANSSLAVESAVTILEPVKAVVLTSRRSLEDYYEPGLEDEMELTVVTVRGIEKYTREGSIFRWEKVTDKKE